MNHVSIVRSMLSFAVGACAVASCCGFGAEGDYCEPCEEVEHDCYGGCEYEGQGTWRCNASITLGVAVCNDEGTDYETSSCWGEVNDRCIAICAEWVEQGCVQQQRSCEQACTSSIALSPNGDPACAETLLQEDEGYWCKTGCALLDEPDFWDACDSALNPT